MVFTSFSQPNPSVELPIIQSSEETDNLDGQETLEKVSFEEALDALNNLVSEKRGKHLIDAEITVMRGTWNEQNYEQMAENSLYSLNYLQRTVAPKFFNLLTKTIGNGEQVTKRNLRTCIEKFILPDDDNLLLNPFKKVKGSQPPNISSFYGRTQELAHLKESVTNLRCISLVGVAGIGKSTLAAKLVAESDSNFNCVIWKSVAHTPSLQDLVTDLLEIIEPFKPKPESIQAMISLLIEHLQKQRYLVVLDECEALFQRDYNLFLRRLVEEQHQSCFLLTSRLLLNMIKELITAKRPIQFLKVEGLDTNAAMQFLSTHGLNDQENCYELIKTYRGNPYELQAIAHRIHNLFGSSELFFQNPTTLVSSKFEAMLDEMFSQLLTDFQRKILIYIAEKTASDSNAISFPNLLEEIKQKNSASMTTLELIKALEKLEQQSLIESIQDPVTKEISFTLQPIIKKYITKDPQGLVHTFNASLPIAS